MKKILNIVFVFILLFGCKPKEEVNCGACPRDIPIVKIVLEKYKKIANITQNITVTDSAYIEISIDTSNINLKSLYITKQSNNNSTVFLSKATIFDYLRINKNRLSKIDTNNSFVGCIELNKKVRDTNMVIIQIRLKIESDFEKYSIWATSDTGSYLYSPKNMIYGMYTINFTKYPALKPLSDFDVTLDASNRKVGRLLHLDSRTINSDSSFLATSSEILYNLKDDSVFIGSLYTVFSNKNENISRDLSWQHNNNRKVTRISFLGDSLNAEYLFKKADNNDSLVKIVNSVIIKNNPTAINLGYRTQAIGKYFGFITDTQKYGVGKVTSFNNKQITIRIKTQN